MEFQKCPLEYNIRVASDMNNTIGVIKYVYYLNEINADQSLFA